MQKIKYTHHNPVSGKWNLAKNFVGYEYSSAAFYELGITQHFLPVHYHIYRVVTCCFKNMLHRGFALKYF